ncbi:MAG: hypothetical protein ACUVQ8_03725 [Nitrososphaeria archaeon]
MLIDLVPVLKADCSWKHDKGCQPPNLRVYVKNTGTNDATVINICINNKTA